jgi:ATP-binding cassette, subfamily B, putative efflux pump
MQKYLPTILRLWKLLRPFHKHFYFQLGATIAIQAINIFSVFMMAKALDAVITKEINILIYVAILYPIASIISNRISLAASFNSLRYLENNIQQYLEEYSFRNIFKLTISQYTDDHSAIKLQTINRGESSVQSIMETLLLSLLPVSTQTIFSLAAIAFYSPVVALWCFVTLCIVIFWSNKFSEYHRPFIKENISNWDTQRKIRTEAFQHLPLIKIFAAEGTYLKKYLKDRLVMLEHSIFTFTKSNIHGHRRGLFMIASRCISYIIIFRLALLGSITTGAIIAIWRWMNDVYDGIQRIIQALRQIPLRFVELEKYLDIIDSEPTFVEGGNIPFVSGDIVLKDIGLTYKNTKDSSLHDVSLHIAAGQKVALVGVSGGGKSSLVKLLLRSYDYSTGSIKIGPTELRDFDYQSLRSHIGYVGQHVDLFDTSIKENILLGVTRTVSNAELHEVAKKARITQFYSRLGDAQLDTVIGERGVKLSGGEQQRVGIARALIRNPEILIFDEATSALDSENESYIKEAIDEASKGRTTIIIAHRLSTVRDADKIVVMDAGTIVAEGTHEELLERSPHYQTLIEHQLS